VEGNIGQGKNQRRTTTVLSAGTGNREERIRDNTVAGETSRKF